MLSLYFNLLLALLALLLCLQPCCSYLIPLHGNTFRSIVDANAQRKEQTQRREQQRTPAPNKAASTRSHQLQQFGAAAAGYASEDDVLTGVDVGGVGAPLRQLLIRMSCDELTPEEISELIFECGVLSCSVESTSERPEVVNQEERWGDLQKTASWATALVRATVSASFDTVGLQELLQLSYPEVRFDMDVVDVEDRDWVSHVQRAWPPQRVGPLTVYFPWHQKEKEADAIAAQTKHVLTLEGGAAFGTGDHPTTVLVLRWLAALEGAGGGSVLDYGCGSAILALAALRFGSSLAVGVDIDRDSLVSAHTNCLLNALDVKLYIADGGGSQSAEEQSVLLNRFKGANARGVEFPSVDTLPREQQFDVVVANILAPILISLAPELAAYNRRGGLLALSGVFESQSATVMQAFAPFYEQLQVSGKEEEWVLITGVRK